MPLVSIEPGVRLFYNTYSPNGSDLDSSKETILILHPRMLDHEIMAPQYNDEQLRKEYNMIAVDHHYHGQSEVIIDDEPYDHVKVCKDLFRLLDSLNMESVHIFGSALGAMIGLYMAVLDPSRVRSLAFCSLPTPVDTQEHLSQYRAMLELASQPDEEGKDALPSNMIAAGKTLYFGNKWSDDDDEMWTAKSNFKPSNKALLAKVFSATIDRKPFEPADWEKIKMPVLLIHGGQDLLCPPAAAHQNYACLTESKKELHIIEGAPHLLSWTDAEKVNGLLLTFLQNLP